MRNVAVVVVVEDDESVRESLPDLLNELATQPGPSCRRRSFLLLTRSPTSRA